MAYTDNVTNWVINDLEGYYYRLRTLDNLHGDAVSIQDAPARRSALEGVVQNNDVNGLRGIVSMRIHHHYLHYSPANNVNAPAYLTVAPLTTAILNSVNWELVQITMRAHVNEPSFGIWPE